MKRKIFTKETKLAAIRELQAGKSVAQICREHEVTASTVSRWLKEYNTNPTHAFAGRGHAVTLEARNAELERVVGRLYLENDFLKKVHQALQQQLAKAKKEK